MIYPPLFATCAADAMVQATFGESPCRVYLFGQAMAATGGLPAKPYAVWQVIGGLPENYISEVPNTDNWSVQVDVYADTATAAREGATALRNAIEPYAHVTSWRGEDRDIDTKNYRCSFDVDWITSRSDES